MDYQEGIYHRQLGEPEESELQRQAAYYQSWVHQSPYTLIIIDENNRVLFWNAAAVQLFGYTAEEALNQNLMELITPAEQCPYGNNLVLALEKGEMYVFGKPTLMKLMGKNHEFFMAEVTFFQTQLEETCHFTVMIRKSDDLCTLIPEHEELQSDLPIEERPVEEVGILFKTIADDVPVPMWVSDEKGKILFLNKAWQSFIGAFEHSPTDINWNELIFQEDLLKLKGDYLAALENRVFYEGEFRIRNINGEYRWVHCVAKPWLNKSHIGSFFDITERKLAEQALIERDAYLEMLGNAMPVFLWQTNEKGELVYVNKAWLNFTGRTLEEEQNRGWMEHIHPDDAAWFIDIYTKACYKREPFQSEYRMQRYDGEYRWLIDHGTPLYSVEGEFKGYIGSCVDITERKQVEQALQESEQRFRNMADTSPVWIWMTDAMGQMTYFNKPLLEFLGLSFEKIQKEGWMQAVHPDDVGAAQQKIQMAITNKQNEQHEFRVRRYDGEYRWWLVKSASRFDGEGNYLGFVASAMDITQRRRTELALQESELRFRNMADASPVWVWMADATGQMTYFNKPVLDYLNMSWEQIQAEGWIKHIHPDDVELLQQEIQAAITERRSEQIEFRVRRYDGEYRWWMAKSAPRYDEEGNYLGFMGTGMDITKRRHAELLAQESEKRFRNMADESPLYIWLVDIATRRLAYVSKPLLDFLGVPFNAELSLEGWMQYVHPDDLEYVRQKIAENIREKRALLSQEFRIRRYDGEYRWWMAKSAPRYDEEGNYLGFVGTGMDVTEQRLATARFRRVSESNIIGVIAWNLDGAILEANEAFLSMIGYTQDDLANGLVNWIMLTPPEYKYLDDACLAQIEKTGTCPPYQKQVLHKEGHRVDILVGSAGMEETPGEGVAFIMDITQRRKDEMALQRAMEREQIRRRILEVTAHATEWAFKHNVAVDLQPLAVLLGQFYQADRCLIISYVDELFHPEVQTLALLGQYCAPGILPAVVETLPEHVLVDFHQPLQALPDMQASTPEELEALLSDELSKLPLVKEEFEFLLQKLKYNLGECLQVQSIVRHTLVYKEKPYGVLVLHQCQSPREWIQEEAGLLKDIAQYLANAFYEAELQLHEREAKLALEKSYNLIRIVSEAQGYFITKEEVHKVFERLLSRLLTHTKSQCGFIGEVLYAADHQPYLKRFLSNIAQNEEGEVPCKQLETHKLDRLYGQVLVSGHVLIDNYLVTELMEDSIEVDQLPLQTFMGIPLYSGDEMVGVVGIANRSGGYTDVMAEELKPYLSACVNLIVGTRNEELRKKLTRELKASERALKNYASKLERSNRDLDQFATIASHDLQAPLRKVIMFSDFLKSSAGDQLPLETYDYIERIQKAVSKMQVLITDLLVLSRINRKGKPFNPVDMSEVLRDVLLDLEPVLQKEHGVVQVKSMMTIDADDVQMHQVLQNLLGNALKFHEPNVPPKVEVEMRVVDDVNCEIIVHDQGIGFDEKYVDRIFEMFERLHGESQFEGTGMGLAIVRKIVERHGGSVIAHGVPGEGATFIVTLPIHHAAGEIVT